MGRVDAQGSMMQMVSLEQLVPQDHFLRKLDSVLDLGFVPGFLQQAYPSNLGPPGVDPVLAIRLILLSYLSESPAGGSNCSSNGSSNTSESSVSTAHRKTP